MKELVAKNMEHYRILRGFNKTEMADAMGVTRSAYSRDESGRTLPRDETLRKFCEIAGCQMTDLLRGFEVPEATWLRNKCTNRRQEEERLESVRKAVEMAKDIRFLLETVEKRTAKRDRETLEAFRARVHKNAGGKGAGAREEFSRDGDFVPEMLPKLMSDQGIIVCQFPFPGDSSNGFSLETPETGCVVAVNASMPWERQIEALAHELGHVVDGTVGKDHGSKRCGDDAEKSATAFYRDFLLPEGLFRKTWEMVASVQGDFSRAVTRVREIHKVPSTLVIHRCVEAKLKTGKAYAEFKATMRRRGYCAEAEPAPLAVRLLPAGYEEDARKAYLGGEISLSKFAGFIGKKIPEAMEIANGDAAE